jgi:hypothetical protein
MIPPNTHCLTHGHEDSEQPVDCLLRRRRACIRVGMAYISAFQVNNDDILLVVEMVLGLFLQQARRSSDHWICRNHHSSALLVGVISS